MGQMLVRNLDDAVIEQLKALAAERGTSLEQMAREALTAAAGDARKAWADRAAALRAQAPRSDVSSVDIIRSWRDRDRLQRLEERREDEAEAARPA